MTSGGASRRAGSPARGRIMSTTQPSIIPQLGALQRRFDEAAQRHAHFPVYRAVEADGSLSISVPDGTSPDALRELRSLATQAEPMLQEAGVAFDQPPGATAEG